MLLALGNTGKYYGESNFDKKVHADPTKVSELEGSPGSFPVYSPVIVALELVLLGGSCKALSITIVLLPLSHHLICYCSLRFLVTPALNIR